MERVNRILQNPYYKECLRKIGDWEKDRIFCGHDTNHLLHVARIAMLLNIEEKMNIPKAHVYAAALLHDIGRFVEYETGEDHAVVSARMAPEFLVAAGFGEDEVAEVVGAIGNHRNKTVAKELNLKGALYRADKLSRDCYFCKAEAECDWGSEKKNRGITW